MTEYLADIPSRQEEESRIVANWLRRIQEVLREDHPHLFLLAIERAGLTCADLKSSEHLSHRQLDVVSEFVRHHVPDVTLRMLKSSDLLDLGLMGYAALSCETVGKAVEVLLRYQDITSDRFLEATETKDGYLCISPVPRWQYVAELISISEDCLGGNWRAIEVLLGPDADLQGASAHFAFSEPDYSDGVVGLTGRLSQCRDVGCYCRNM
jgi:hypothetical protein